MNWPRHANPDWFPPVGHDGLPALHKPPLRILVADDHPAVRTGLRELITTRPELDVVGEAADGFEALAQAHAVQPDVVLMDVTMPHMDGVEATRRIHAECPSVRVVALSMHDPGHAAPPIVEAGAVAYFVKGRDTRALLALLLEMQALREDAPRRTLS